MTLYFVPLDASISIPCEPWQFFALVFLLIGLGNCYLSRKYRKFWATLK